MHSKPEKMEYQGLGNVSEKANISNVYYHG